MHQARTILDDPDARETFVSAAESNEENADARFFFSRNSLRVRAARLRAQFPEEVAVLAEDVEPILAHRLCPFGGDKLAVGDSIEWHKDYDSGYVWPADRPWTGSIEDLARAEHARADIRFPWELSSMAWTPTLTAAFALSEDSRLSAAFERDVSDWLVQNPYPLGVNWASPMAVAMRAIHLTVGLVGFGDALCPELRRDLRRSLALHGLHVAASLEIDCQSGHRNNHYLANLLGLYVVSFLFLADETWRHWNLFAENELQSDSLVQFFEDGASFEHATAYHRLAAEMVLVGLVLARHNGRAFREEIRSRLHRAVTFIADLMTEAGAVPQIGDNDSARVLQFHGYGRVPAADHRPLVALGGELFHDDPLRRAGAAAASEAVWMLDHWSPPDASEEASDCRSFAYDRGGVYGMRAGSMLWAATLRPALHAAQLSSHVHADRLSFTLHRDGLVLVADPGTYRYSSDYAARNAFRSPGYHNVVEVDGFPMIEMDDATFEGPWYLTARTSVKTPVFDVRAGVGRFSGTLIVRRGIRACRVRREMLVDTDRKTVTVSDSVLPVGRVSGFGPQAQVSARLMFGPAVRVERRDPYRYQLLHRESRVAVGTVDIRTFECSSALRETWYSPSYGKRVPVDQLQITWRPAATKTALYAVSWA